MDYYGPESYRTHVVNFIKINPHFLLVSDYDLCLNFKTISKLQCYNSHACLLAAIVKLQNLDTILNCRV